MISAVILSAGSSSRMGSPKALLEIGGVTFLRHIVDVLASASVLDVVIVLGSESGRIRPSLGWFGGTIVENAAWRDGQLSSVIAGIDAVSAREGVHGAMLCPVDHPLISHSLIVDLLQVFWRSKKKIIIPLHKGVRGHPVIFRRELFAELRSAPGAVGARAVVRGHPAEIAEVPTEVQGAVINIDTAAEYERYVSGTNQ
jgi:molybdenum cofactor cytidylyltransferase